MDKKPLILYQDDDLVAVHKPSGVHVHPSEFSPNERSLMQDLRDFLGARVDPLHRIDRGTSGVVLFALNKDMTRLMSELFRQNDVEKSYLAVCRGWLEADILHESIETQGESPVPMATWFRRLHAVELPFSDGRHASMRISTVEAKPVGGRRHQIRRHLASLRHPIVGDVRYGSGLHNRAFRENYGLNRLLLFAQSLSFRHPKSQDQCDIVAPVIESEVLAFFREVGFRDPLVKP